MEQIPAYVTLISSPAGRRSSWLALCSTLSCIEGSETLDPKQSEMSARCHHADREAVAVTAAGLLELHAAAVRALRAALDQLAAPRHLRLIMYLSMLAFHTLPGARLSYLSCKKPMQHLELSCIKWSLYLPAEQPSSNRSICGHT